jgi:hypothetical protein
MSVSDHQPPAPLSAATWRDATIVFVIFTVAQVADGFLTYWGVGMLGVGAEGNHLLVTSIGAIGVSRALISAKLLACVCGYILYRTATHRPLAIAAGLYLGTAIAPWLIILSQALG